MTNLPEEIRSAMNTALDHAQQEGSVFDVYEAAVKVGETFPDAGVRIDDLVDYMVGHIRGILAMEISPPALLIEIVLPAGDETVSGAAPKNSSLNDEPAVRAMIDSRDRAQIRGAHTCIEESWSAIEKSAPMLQLHRPSPLTALATRRDARARKGTKIRRRSTS